MPGIILKNKQLFILNKNGLNSNDIILNFFLYLFGRNIKCTTKINKTFILFLFYLFLYLWYLTGHHASMFRASLIC